MALERTNTIGLQDLVCLIHFDAADANAPDRHIPCPWNGFVERIYLANGGVIATSAYTVNVRHYRGGVQQSTRAITVPSGTGADQVQTFNYDPIAPEIEFQVGDVLEFDSAAGGAGTAAEPVTATVVLRRQ